MTTTSSSPSLGDLARASAEFENAHPLDVVRWTAEQFGEGAVCTASFEDAVLVSLLAKAAPSIEIVLIDTQYLFAETEWFAEQLRQRLDLRLTVIHPLPNVVPDNLWQTDTAACCGVRKVEPLARALQGRTAWITGVRRVDAPTRANAPIVSFDVNRNLVKINPVATWSNDDMELYRTLEDLPKNPLTDRGYPSIGCWPCTEPVAAGADPRSGRWAGSGKVECGLHV
jgi:phosphoadenosine phosphosulfate reductase